MDFRKIFIDAINNKELLSIKFNSKEKGVISRKCVPYDIGPWRRNLAVNPDRFHVYDLECPDGENHNLSMLSEQIISMVSTQESFDPKDYINFVPNWFVPRDWGEFS